MLSFSAKQADRQNCICVCGGSAGICRSFPVAFEIRTLRMRRPCTATPPLNVVQGLRGNCSSGSGSGSGGGGGFSLPVFTPRRALRLPLIKSFLARICMARTTLVKHRVSTSHKYSSKTKLAAFMLYVQIIFGQVRLPQRVIKKKKRKKIKFNQEKYYHV